MTDNIDPIKEIPADFYENQLMLDFVPGSGKEVVDQGIIHKDFILTHPRGNYPVCGHRIHEGSAAIVGRNYCLQPAGNGTIHVGEGFCKHHERGNPVARITHGRYSKYLHGVLSSRLEALSSDPEILSLNDEIVLLRALLTELITLKENSESRLTYLVNNPPNLGLVDLDITIEDKSKAKAKKELQAEYEIEIKQLKRENHNLIGAIQDAVEKVSKTVETKDKIENGSKFTIKIEHIQLIVVQIVSVIKKYVTDPEIVFKMSKEISQLGLPTKDHSPDK